MPEFSNNLSEIFTFQCKKYRPLGQKVINQINNKIIYINTHLPQAKGVILKYNWNNTINK